MTDQHRATPEQWEHVQISAGMKQQIPWATADCILELRSRIEALEAAQREAPMTELRAASAEARPTVKDSLTDGGGLVERVAETMATPSLPAREWRDESCAVIRAAAAWFRKQGGYPNEWTAQMLEQEADRG